ncbi:MAG: hypothetical protein ACYC99_16630 [Candidatus Geothermincolia bacterium]
MAAGAGIVTKLMGEKELEGVLASIGARLAAEGFVPKGGVPGLFVFERKKEPSILITILLLLLWIIPGIVYLLLAREHTIVSIEVRELPLNIQVDGSDTDPMPVGLSFGINAPMKITRQITNMLSPYTIDVDQMIAHPQLLTIGKTFVKQTEVDCDHCGRRQTVSIPLRIEGVVGTKGYGPGGSITVTCGNPDCGKPFEVTWDSSVAELDFKS